MSELLTHDRYGPAMVRLWTGCGPSVDWLWTSFGPAVDRLWSGCGPTADWLWTGCGQAVDRLRTGGKHDSGSSIGFSFTLDLICNWKGIMFRDSNLLWLILVVNRMTG